MMARNGLWILLLYYRVIHFYCVPYSSIILPITILGKQIVLSSKSEQ